MPQEGVDVIYKVADPRVFDLLNVAKDVIAGSLSEARDLLEELQNPELADAVPAPQPPSEAQ